jgi:calcineurin-like phosphoesterase family protein
MSTWFTSDLHFGHTNILRFCNRPYTDVTQMNKDLVLRFNSVVRPREVVYFIGDIVWDKKCMDILPALHGVHYFILGGHDRRFFVPKTTPDPPDGIHINEIWEGRIEGQEMVLCHFPLREWNGSYHGWWHIHGHSHGRATEPGNCVDVSVDAWDYYPASFEQIKKRIGEGTAPIHASSEAPVPPPPYGPDIHGNS